MKIIIHRQLVTTWVCAAGLLGLVGLNTSCDNKKTSEQAVVEIPDLTDSLKEDQVDSRVRQFIHIFPSHLRVALAYKNAGLKFNQSLLNPTENSTKYLTTFDRSFALGVYSVDLAYAVLNKQTQTSINVLKACKKLGEQLGLDGIYEQSGYVEKFEKYLDNQDSIRVVVADLFAESDAFLKDNDKLDVMLLSLAGGWTEALYIATSNASTEARPEIVELIGDQLITLEPLLDLMKEGKSDIDFKPLIADLEGIGKLISVGVVSQGTDTEPPVYKLNNQQIKDINQAVSKLRAKIINPA
jgi:hypothetical protein